MPTLELKDKVYELDEAGYLVDPNAWTREFAEKMAEEEGIALTDAHWKVIEFVRNYYAEKGKSPTLRQISKGGGFPMKELYKLFPKGPAKKVARIAGVPKPEGCV